MNRSSLFFLFLFVAMAGGLVSCVKKQNTGSTNSELDGKWKLAQTATDDNGNKQIDGSEIHSVPSGQDYELTFNANFTGVENDIYDGVVSTPLSFSWALINNDYLYSAFASHDTITYYIVSMSSNNLVLQANTQTGLTAYYYNKK